MNRPFICILAAISLILIAVAALGAPSGPDSLTKTSSSRRDLSGTPPIGVSAQAGNVSELRINSIMLTQGWQGFYGNVSGTIVLDDANNNSLYTWDLTSPNGEIFATRASTINWTNSNIICANISHIQSEETTLNFNSGVGQDTDGINETFNLTTHPAFNISSTSFAPSQCNFSVSPYVNDAVDPNRAFNETLIYSKSDSSIVYTAFIKQGHSDGFRTGAADLFDFEMLVAEDGHLGDSSPTTYNFYVELG